MPARRIRLRTALAVALAAFLAAPSVARAQASSSVVARVTVAPARTPRLALSVAGAPVVTARTAGTGTSTRRSEGAVLVTSAIRVVGNTGYRLFVRARTEAEGAGISVRDASGAFRSLAGGAAIEVARGSGGDEVRDVVHRVDRSATALPVVYELVYDPVS